MLVGVLQGTVSQLNANDCDQGLLYKAPCSWWSFPIRLSWRWSPNLFHVEMQRGGSVLIFHFLSSLREVSEHRYALHGDSYWTDWGFPTLGRWESQIKFFSQTTAYTTEKGGYPLYSAVTSVAHRTRSSQPAHLKVCFWLFLWNTPVSNYAALPPAHFYLPNCLPI